MYVCVYVCMCVIVTVVRGVCLRVYVCVTRSMTVEFFMSLCVHHVEENLKPKGYGAGKKASILIFDGHASRWSYAGIMYLMANNC